MLRHLSHACDWQALDLFGFVLDSSRRHLLSIPAHSSLVLAPMPANLPAFRHLSIFSSLHDLCTASSASFPGDISMQALLALFETLLPARFKGLGCDCCSELVSDWEIYYALLKE